MAILNSNHSLKFIIINQSNSINLILVRLPKIFFPFQASSKCNSINFKCNENCQPSPLFYNSSRRPNVMITVLASIQHSNLDGDDETWGSSNQRGLLEPLPSDRCHHGSVWISESLMSVWVDECCCRIPAEFVHPVAELAVEESAAERFRVECRREMRLLPSPLTATDRLVESTWRPALVRRAPVLFDWLENRSCLRATLSHGHVINLIWNRVRVF